MQIMLGKWQNSLQGYLPGISFSGSLKCQYQRYYSWSGKFPQMKLGKRLGGAQCARRSIKWIIVQCANLILIPLFSKCALPPPSTVPGVNSLIFQHLHASVERSTVSSFFEVERRSSCLILLRKSIDKFSLFSPTPHLKCT